MKFKRKLVLYSIIGMGLGMFYDVNKNSYLETKETLIRNNRRFSEDEMRGIIENRDLIYKVFFGASKFEYNILRIRSFFTSPGRYTAYLLHEDLNN